jgi:cell division protein FtsI (penicillin-binding protein 3)
VEGQLQEYLQAKQAERGLAICLDVKTGAVLAWAGRPSYNPNYYWQLADTTGAGIFQEALDPGLFRDFLVRAAALTKNGELGDPLPPDTVAAVDYGLRLDEVSAFGEVIGLNQAGSWLPVPVAADVQDVSEQSDSGQAAAGVNALQLARAAASLVNGGWYVAPHALAGVYAHEGQELYTRSADFDAANRRQVVSPSMGIRLRRDLFATQTGAAQAVSPEKGQAPEKMIIHSASIARMDEAEVGNSYVMQDLLLGVIPAKAPALLLLMVAQRDKLYPLVKSAASAPDAQVSLARKILPALLAAAQGKSATAPAAERDPANFTQFLISRRMDFQEQPGAPSAGIGKMPEVTGLSLRKGLQRLNPYHLLVNIEGSGRIIRQSPAAGSPLQGVDDCTLTLETKRGGS